MRPIQLIFVILIMSGLIACGNTTNDSQEQNEQVATETEDTSEETNEDVNNEKDDDDKNAESSTEDESSIPSKMDSLPFNEFELEVEYANNQEYEVDIDRESNGQYKVKLEDELTGIELRGEEAFDELYPLLKELSIEKGTPKDQVIKDVLTAFDLSDDYTEFELEIEFNDGVELEFKDKP